MNKSLENSMKDVFTLAQVEPFTIKRRAGCRIGEGCDIYEAAWHLVLLRNVSSSPDFATLPAVAHYTLTLLVGPPPAWLRFNYTQCLDPPQARTINLSALEENGKRSPLTAILIEIKQTNSFQWSQKLKFKQKDKRLQYTGWHLRSSWDKCAWCVDVCTIVFNLLGDSLITHLRAYANGVSLFIQVSLLVVNDRESLGVGCFG